MSSALRRDLAWRGSAPARACAAAASGCWGWGERWR